MKSTPSIHRVYDRRILNPIYISYIWQPCYQPQFFPVQGQYVSRQFIQRPYNEELLLPHTWHGSLMFLVPILQPLLNLEPTNTR